MIWFLRAITARMRSLHTYLLVLAVAFAVAWVVMALAEPHDATIDDPDTYWWWFLVTAFTVGYGDTFPVTVAGRLAAVGVMAVTIGVLAAIVNNAVSAAAQRRSRRVRGEVTVTVEKHIIVVGYHVGRTEALLAELRAADNDVVLLADHAQLTAHPVLDDQRVEFVRGNPRDPESLRRAHIAAARGVIVDEESDDAATLTALVIARTRSDLPIVVSVREVAQVDEMLHRFGKAFEVVERHDIHMLTEAAQDPGITRFYTDLKSSGSGTDSHSLVIPTGIATLTLADIMMPVKTGCNATICAVRDGEVFVNNPPLDSPLRSGMVLYYIGSRRLTWADIESATNAATKSEPGGRP